MDKLDGGRELWLANRRKSMDRVELFRTTIFIDREGGKWSATYLHRDVSFET